MRAIGVAGVSWGHTQSRSKISRLPYDNASGRKLSLFVTRSRASSNRTPHPTAWSWSASAAPRPPPTQHIVALVTDHRAHRQARLRTPHPSRRDDVVAARASWFAVTVSLHAHQCFDIGDRFGRGGSEDSQPQRYHRIIFDGTPVPAYVRPIGTRPN